MEPRKRLPLPLRLANHGWWLVGIIVVNLSVCATIFSISEGISWILSLYWAIVVGWTCGLGDVPVTATPSFVLTGYTIITFWFLLLLGAAKIITRLVLDADKFTHEEQELLKLQLQQTIDALAVTDAKLEELKANMFDEIEQQGLLEILMRIDANTTTS